MENSKQLIDVGKAPENLLDNDSPERIHRKKIEKAILRKEKDIFAMKDRLYTLRYDTSLSNEELMRNVKNISRELNRLETGLQFLRQQAWEDFETSLNLQEIGMQSIIQKPKVLTPAPQRQRKLSNSEDPELNMPFDDSLKMMRTRSTATLADQTATQKWQSLFRMFREWRHHTTVAEARQILSKEDKALKQEQLAKCRAAIYSLQSKKKLSQTDQILLQQLRSRLRQLSAQLSTK